ncbi:hypothetical protein TRICI_006705 [Trichomonascus ciferrii]|uniref:Uncharacterized protein n=1 Tax=Trichomonascus ciferrii TaxID=44093 RepID=A0A642UEL0_9ASCO|nr:hypothetical protein TRICI_006705 [Trichomonascus ciferrii]
MADMTSGQSNGQWTGNKEKDNRKVKFPKVLQLDSNWVYRTMSDERKDRHSPIPNKQTMNEQADGVRHQWTSTKAFSRSST